MLIHSFLDLKCKIIIEIKFKKSKEKKEGYISSIIEYLIDQVQLTLEVIFAPI